MHHTGTRESARCREPSRRGRAVYPPDQEEDDRDGGEEAEYELERIEEHERAYVQARDWANGNSFNTDIHGSTAG